jgi:Putative addiction module component
MSTATTLPLNELSHAAKLRLMEELWDDLCHSSEGVTSPAWHGEVLAARAAGGERRRRIPRVGGGERTTSAEEVVRIQILREAEDDLQDGREFYDRQELGVGGYFASALAADIDSLILFADIHPMQFGLHRALSKRLFSARKLALPHR